LEPDHAKRLSTRLSNAFVLDLIKLGSYGRDIIDPLIRAALMHAGVAHVMQDPELQVRYATFDCDVPDELRRPTSVNAVATSLAIPFETVRRRINGFAAEGACLAVAKGFVVPAAVTGSPFFHMACQIQHAKLLDLHAQLLGAGAVPPTVSAARDWPEPPVRLAGRFVGAFVLRFRELIAPLLPDVVSSAVFMDMLEANVEPLPLTLDGGLGEAFADSARAPAGAAQVAQRLGIPDETVRRHLVGLAERGYCVRAERGYIVPGARLASAEFDRLFTENHRNLLRLFVQLASFDALRPIETESSSGRLAG
jgi:hypothetical protein